MAFKELNPTYSINPPELRARREDLVERPFTPREEAQIRKAKAQPEISAGGATILPYEQNQSPAIKKFMDLAALTSMFGPVGGAGMELYQQGKNSLVSLMRGEGMAGINPLGESRSFQEIPSFNKLAPKALQFAAGAVGGPVAKIATEKIPENIQSAISEMEIDVAGMGLTSAGLSKMVTTLNPINLTNKIVSRMKSIDPNQYLKRINDIIKSKGVSAQEAEQIFSRFIYDKARYTQKIMAAYGPVKAPLKTVAPSAGLPSPAGAIVPAAKEAIRKGFRSLAPRPVPALASPEVTPRFETGLMEPEVPASIGQEHYTNLQKFKQYYTPSKNLTPQEKVLAQKALNYVYANINTILKDYYRMHLNVINADDMRALLKPAGYNGLNSNAFQEAASALIKIAEERILAHAVKEGKNQLLVMAGYGGASKTTAIKEAMGVETDSFAMVMDATLSNYSKNLIKVNKWIKDGFEPNIMFVFRDPIKAWFQGVIGRLIHAKGGTKRAVNAGAWLDAVKGIADDVLKFSEIDGVKFTPINNELGGPKNAKPVTKDSMNKMLELYRDPLEIESLKRRIIDGTVELYRQKQISADELKALLGKWLPEDIRAEIEPSRGLGNEQAARDIQGRVEEAVISETAVAPKTEILAENKTAFGSQDQAVAAVDQAAAQMESEAKKIALLKRGQERKTKIYNELKARGFVDLRGTEIRGIHDVAEAGCMFRNPKIEQLQFMLVKDGKIVSHQVVTSGMGHSVARSPKRTVRMKQLAEKFGINADMNPKDGVYIIHNHPVGNPEPSTGDKNVAQLEQKILGNLFRGSYVLNGRKFSVIIPSTSGRFYQSIYRFDYAKPKPVYSLGEIPIKSKGSSKVIAMTDIVDAAKGLLDGSKYNILFIDGKYRISAVENISDSKNIGQFITENLRRYKVRRYFIIQPKGMELKGATLPKGIQDILTMDGNRVISNAAGSREETIAAIKETTEPFKVEEKKLTQMQSPEISPMTHEQMMRSINSIALTIPQTKGSGNIPAPVVSAPEQVAGVESTIDKAIANNPTLFPTKERSAISANMDYGISFEPENLCARGYSFTVALDNMRNALESLPSDIKTAAGRKLLSLGHAEGLETPCNQCYVAEKRILGNSAKSSEAGLSQYKTGEIDKHADLVKEIGERMYSSGNFAPSHIPSVIRNLQDLKRLGAGAGTYTKNLNFPEIFGDTGIKFNISSGKTTAVGIPLEIIDVYRKRYPNVSSVYVAVNDADVRAIGADPRVDHIIPAHIGAGTPKELLDSLSGLEWENFARTQSEKVPVTLTVQGKKGPIKVKRDVNLFSKSTEAHFPKAALDKAREMIKKGMYTGDGKRYLVSVKKASKILGTEITPKFAQYKTESWYSKLIGSGPAEYGKTNTFEPIDLSKMNTQKALEYFQKYPVIMDNKVAQYKSIADRIVEAAQTGGIEAINALKPKEPSAYQTYYGEEDLTPAGITPIDEVTPPPTREEDTKIRKFINTVKYADKTAQQVADTIDSRYTPITNKETLVQAQLMVETNLNEAIGMANSIEAATPLSNAVAITLIDRYQMEGRWEDARQLIEHTAKRNTPLGQTIQALSMYERLTPEGILRYADSVLRNARAKLPKETLAKWERMLKDIKEEKQKVVLAKKLGIPYLSDELMARIYAQAIKVGSMAPSREKSIQVALMLKMITSEIPRSILTKISMVQTMAQLLNPKTIVRNILGNTGFMAAENLSDTVGTALDAGISTITGKRTQYLPNLKTQAKGLKQGWKEGLEESLAGVNLGPTGDKFDLPQNSIFDEGVMGGLEKTLNIVLRAPDRANYQAAFNASLFNQCKVAGIPVSKATPEMIELAHYDGLYRTFQDDSVIARVLVGLKRALNAKKEWGLGDMIIKYPKTPANILARGIEYSPAGYVASVMHLAKPLFGKDFNQREFVKTASRATVGTALYVAVGAILGGLGIITGRREKDVEAAQLLRDIGLGEYKINISALKRYVASGFDSSVASPRKNDIYVSYDWMLPTSIPLAMGANLATSKEGSFIDNVIDASNTLVEQPLLQGIKKAFSSQSIITGFTDMMKGIPASFVPTILNQVKQLTDNVSRNTRDVNYFKEAYNRVAAKVPFLAKTLPANVNTFGETKETYQGDSNNPFNVFLNPAFVGKYDPSPEAMMVLKIWKATGETGQFPRIAPKSVTIDGHKRELTPEEQNMYQSYIGNKTGVLYRALADDPQFMSQPDEQKAKILQGFLTDINAAAKIELFGAMPRNVTADVKGIIYDIAGWYKKSAYKRAKQTPLPRGFKTLAPRP